MANELVVANPQKMRDLAIELSKSALIPTAYKRPEDCFYALMLGADLGLTEMFSLTNIYVVNNKPSLMATGKLSMVLASGLLKGMEVIEETDKICKIKMERTIPAMSKTMEFTIEQAQKAGLLGKDVWKNYPARMLKSKVVGWLCDDIFPDICKGVATKEDLEDLPPEHKTETPIYSVSDKPSQELANMLKEINDLLKEKEMPPDKDADYRMSAKGFFTENDLTGMQFLLNTVRTWQPEKAEELIAVAEPEPEPEHIDIPEQGTVDEISQSIRDLWARIAKEYNAIPSYSNEAHQTRSSNQHLGVERHTQCQDEAKLKKYIAYLVSVKNGKSKEVELPTLDEAYKSVEEFLNSHSADYTPEVSERECNTLAGLYNANDVEGLVAMLSRLQKASDVPFA